MADDLSKTNKEFKEFVNESSGFKAWQILEKEASTLRTDISELSLVSKNLDAIEKAGGYTKWKALGDVGKVPTRLVIDGKILRGSSQEYSLAKKIVNEYIQGEIYKIKKSGLPEIEQKKAIANLQKQNKAYLEGKIDNLIFDKSEIRKSGDIFDKEQIFNAYKVDKDGGVNTNDAWLRNQDTEYVMLSEIAHSLGAKKGEIYNNITGELKIVSELTYCTSCQGVIQDFSKMFPNVDIVLIDNLKY